MTGFLGSGKTTLLKRYLQQQAVGSTLVIINEFGRESIDDRITLHLKSEIETIADGCLCCTVLGQLQQTLLHILTRRARGELPELQRIIVETSGLADPTPILGTVLSDENLHEYIKVGPCVTAFDALEGLQTLKEFAEAAPQLAAADRVIVTKTDLADSADIETVITAIRDVNPACDVTLNDVPDTIFAPIESVEIVNSPLRAANTSVHLHTGSVRSFSTVLDRSVDWATFSVWLTALLNRHGDHILRFKSVLAVRSAGKLVVQGVRHRVYPPSHLPAEDNEDNVSRLVFISNGINDQIILDSLKRFTAATSTFNGLSWPAL
ncbi:GTP-binding protein (plasmid) [Paraburkholderia sp. D15]|uniref:CobW family GTP-binding protein n=1 Tax=Paraburkholderia sp. D15 TaxID=2880218 RepID=UPI00247907FB|nr:GTP-binding protein [Paraburkholderia sp. D15]WGS54900.1 GTP-binding protein [Paraburkholderia sp. D15]